MANLKVFVLQYLPTGEFLPQRMFRSSNRGFSLWKPWEKSFERPYDPTPRIFRTKQSAANCLGQLLRGYPVDVPISRSVWDDPDYKRVWEKSPYHTPSNFRILEALIHVQS